MKNKKILAGLMAALLITTSASTTAFAALEKPVAEKQQTVQSEKTVKKQSKKVKVTKKKNSKIKDKQEKDNEQSWQQDMLKSVNEARKKAGKSELKLNEKLCEAAQIRAEECLKKYDHKRPDGSECTTAMDEVGVKYSYWGENINEKQESVSSTMKSWLGSKGHKANIVNGNFDQVGFGRAKDKSGKYYWVQMFAKVK